MLLGDIAQLLSAVQTFKDRQHELNRQFLEQFIEPMWAAFTRVHDDYKQSFREYTEIIAMDSMTMRDFIQRIQRDALYARDLRSALFALVSNFPRDRIKQRGQAHLFHFLYALSYYFSGRALLQPGEDVVQNGRAGVTLLADDPETELPEVNMTRLGLILYLDAQPGDSNRQEILGVLDDFMFRLQLGFDEVAGAYQALKVEMTG